MAIREFGGPDGIEQIDAPDPLVGPDSILIRVIAAGVNPVDAKIRTGASNERWPHFFPLILGWDAAGVVEQVGPAITDIDESDEVYAYCRKDYVRDGTYAEFVSVRDMHVAPKPKTANWDQAAATPLAALTAFQALHDSLRVERGAAETIDYTGVDFAQAVREAHPDGVDHVLDLVGGETLERSGAVVRPQGGVASVLVPRAPDSWADFDMEYSYVFVRPDAGQLTSIASLIDQGDLRVELQEVFGLEDAARAHEQIESGHTRGKVVLRVAAA